MKKAPVVCIGPLIRDIVYVQYGQARSKHLVHEQGGGSQWNALLNARHCGAVAEAACILGSDAAGGKALKDLRSEGVKIRYHQSRPKHLTRTIHEVLRLDQHGNKTPQHKFHASCLVCGEKTYGSHISGLLTRHAEQITREFSKSQAPIIIHTDGLDKRRKKIIEDLRKQGIPVTATLDLGRSTGLFRMRNQDPINRLSGFDVLFIHNTAEEEFRNLIGAKNIREAAKKLGAKLIVVTHGADGIQWATPKQAIQTNPAPPAGDILDTAGAGDAFIGSFLARLSANAEEIQDNLIDLKWIQDSLDQAQDWASQSIAYLGARGHLNPGSALDIRSRGNRIKTQGTIKELQVQNLGSGKCSACGAPITGKQSLAGSLRYQTNVAKLPKRGKEAWSQRENSQWLELSKLQGSGTTIGTGGSFAVADFLAHALNRHGCHTLAQRPFDFIRLGPRSEWAIFVSHSGKTPDIAAAWHHAAQLGIKKRILITSAKTFPSDLKATDGDLLCTVGSGAERGFLSVAGVTIPMWMANEAIAQTSWDQDSHHEQFQGQYEDAKSAARKTHAQVEDFYPNGLSGRDVLILGGGWAWPAMLDLESKFVESGFGHVTLSEIKDYSHGRFVSSMGRDSIIILMTMPDDQPYRAYLLRNINKTNPVIRLDTDRTGPEGAIDLTLQGQHFLRYHSELEGRDYGKPAVIDRRGLALYKFTNLHSFEG